MKLRKRQKRKTAQALDAAAGVTKLWSEWQIGKRAGKGVAKVKKSGAKGKLSSKHFRIAGLVAVLGGAGAAVAKKLKGGGREPIYTPPGEGEPVAPPDVAPPLAIAPDPATPTDATMPQGQREPAIGAAGLRADADDSAPSDDATAGTEADADADADADAEPEPAASARPKPTTGGVEPAVPTDEPLPEPSTPAEVPEPIADTRGGGAPSGGDEQAGKAADPRPDNASVAEDD
ncbi:MAG: hypothetical protein QOE31_2448 [Solirubrobacteraceae bacterium]|nr:hypothetical protein [Solirubrobacteraceae bacterium]